MLLVCLKIIISPHYMPIGLPMFHLPGWYHPYAMNLLQMNHKKAIEIAEKMTRTMFSTNKYDKVRENKSMITKQGFPYVFSLHIYLSLPRHVHPVPPGSMLGDRRSKLLPCAGEVVAGWGPLVMFVGL